MRERIRAHHGLIRRHGHAEHVSHQPAGPAKLPRIDAGIHTVVVAARAQSHHHFLQRGIAGPFADAVDGAFHLPRAVHHTAQGVGRRQAQVVVTMHADDRPCDVRDVLANRADQCAVLLRHRVAGGVGNIDYSSSGLDGRL